MNAQKLDKVKIELKLLICLLIGQLSITIGSDNPTGTCTSKGYIIKEDQKQLLSETHSYYSFRRFIFAVC